MPKQYEDIRDSYVARGKPLKEAKRIAAMTYIARGKGKGGRSGRAKQLHDAPTKSGGIIRRAEGGPVMPGDERSLMRKPWVGASPEAMRQRGDRYSSSYENSTYQTEKSFGGWRRAEGGPVEPNEALRKEGIAKAKAQYEVLGRVPQGVERRQEIQGLLSQIYSGEVPRGRARGGGVLGRGAYLVGEKGPELFVPKRKGTIVSNKKIRGILGK